MAFLVLGLGKGHDGPDILWNRRRPWTLPPPGGLARGRLQCTWPPGDRRRFQRSPRTHMTAATMPCCRTTPSDEQLLACFTRGDRAALDELFRRYRQPAYRVAYRLLGNEADALD